jgi:sarcosine oxidase, subunit alpha
MYHARRGMPHRLYEPSQPVSLSHDGESVAAQRGEPLVLPLLVAAGHALSRSPKLHRPRGPYCLRGACEGCLVRVDGVPNVMACQHRVRGGERVETQNVLGTRELDLLGATDYLFPRGMDHHRLFAGVRGVSSLVQAFARRVSGLGTLADAAEAERPAERREVEALVVGGGAAGLAAAAVLGQGSLLVDDQLELGGALAALEPEAAAAAIAKAERAGCELAAHATVAGLFREPEDGSGRLTALVVSEQGALLVRARQVLIAAGTHDASPLFENNDAPGVLSARAALMLLRRGVAVGRQVAVVGDGRFARRFSELARGRIEVVELDPESIVGAVGRTELSRVAVRAAGSSRRLRADALIFDGPGAPAFELCVQAGAQVSFDPARGYLPQRDASGRVAEGVFAAGSLAGALESAADGERVAGQLLSAR